MARQGIYDLPEKAALNLLAIQATRLVEVSETLGSMSTGNTYTGTFLVKRILNSTKRWIGEYGDSSLTPDGSIFKTEKETEGAVTANGDYYIDYHTGYYKVKAGGNGTPTITYFVEVPYMVGANAAPYLALLSGDITKTVTHNLGYIPQVWVLDTDGNVISCNINHASDMNSFTLTFAEAQSGKIYYR